MRRQELARVIDYALVKPINTLKEIERACIEVLNYNIGVLCVLPPFVEFTAEKLAGSDSKVCAVVSFPFGSSPTEVKVREAQQVIAAGAEEVDFVMNIPLFKSGDYDFVKQDIENVTMASKKAGEKLGKEIVVKVIIETGYLSSSEIALASRLAEEGGADFVKTCTGFGPRGATLEDVKIILSSVRKAKVKAAGGISNYAKALEFVKCGASRIGTSNAPHILNEAPP